MKQLCELGLPPEAFQGLFLDALQDAELVLLVLRDFEQQVGAQSRIPDGLLLKPLQEQQLTYNPLSCCVLPNISVLHTLDEAAMFKVL